jgi:putative glutamine amidotransferase
MATPSPKPLIGITVTNKDNSSQSKAYQSATAYSDAVAAGGGLPMMMAQDLQLAGDYARRLDGVIFTGGMDLRMEPFGQTSHPAIRPLDPQRQAFETALLAALDQLPHKPVLGICLGMQMLAVHSGGRLHQYLPEQLMAPQVHRGNFHAVCLQSVQTVLLNGCASLPQRELVRSNHQQAVRDPGRLRVVARAADGIIEAVDDPARPFFLGVQWHPELGGQGELNLGLIARFVAACRGATCRSAAH